MRTSKTSRKSAFYPPRGVVTLEVIVLLPILMILLLAVFQFGLIMAAAQHVEFASRLGAKLAAETTNLAIFNLPATPDNLKQQVDQYLITAGYTASCQVILEHNVAGMGNPVQINPSSPVDCPCTPIGSLPMNVAVPPSGTLSVESVRVTVCLSIDGNVPNFLETLGCDLSPQSIRQSTVWNYELP